MVGERIDRRALREPSAGYWVGTRSATHISPTITVPATAQIRSTNPPIRAKPMPSGPDVKGQWA